MKYKTSQEISSDRLARQLLAFKGYNPDGIASALGKIIGYYNLHQRNKDIPRYGSIGNLQKRIEKAGESHSLSARPYPTDHQRCRFFQRKYELRQQAL